MTLKAFLTGSVSTVLVSIILGMISGLAWYVTLGLALVVWFTAQILYVGFIWLSARKIERPGEDKLPPRRTRILFKVFTRDDQV